MTKTAFRLVSAGLASSCLGPARFAPALALGIALAGSPVAAQTTPPETAPTTTPTTAPTTADLPAVSLPTTAPDVPAASTATGTGTAAPDTAAPVGVTPAATPTDAAPPVGTTPEPAPAAAPQPTAAPAALPTPSAAPPAAIPADALPHDLSPLGMYRQADIVVKGVMLGLVFASIVTWTVLVVKLFEYLSAMASVGRGAGRIEAADTLRAALGGADGRSPDARMLRAAARELNRSGPDLAPAGIQDRIGSELGQIQARAVRQMNRGTGVLATIGSTAPFVGLFGTVWGIMNSFIGISEAQTTNLAVVAPGIAEALLATAIGLVAAIPAVVIYNVFARASGGYRLRLTEAAAGVQRLVSRDLDRRAAGQAV